MLPGILFIRQNKETLDYFVCENFLFRRLFAIQILKIYVEPFNFLWNRYSLFFDSLSSTADFEFYFLSIRSPLHGPLEVGQEP